MSNSVFPALVGLTWPVVKQPLFSTKIQRAVSGKEYRAAFMQYPLMTFTLPHDMLRDAAAFGELQAVMGFFNARQGSFDNFLFNDVTDNTAASQSFGTGDGNTTTFQLARTYGNGTANAVDLVMNPNVITSVYNNASNIPHGAGAGKYTVDGAGLVTFGTAPAANAAITWNGTFYYRCRFVADSLDFNEHMSGLWDLMQLQLIGSTQNKV
jgi:uncharacterized protein (TIGR02217 family)